MECKNMVYSIRITLYKINGSGIYTHNLCYMVLEISSTCSHAIGNILDFRYSDLEYTNWILLLGHISRAYLKDTQTFNPLFLTCSFLYHAPSGAPAPLKVIIRLLDLVAILYFRMALVVGVGDHKGPQATPKALSRPSTVFGFCPKTRDQDRNIWLQEP